MSLTAGTHLGSYEILALIGAGGMGEVYRAHDTKLGRDVAIKVLPESFAHDAERMARFEREAQVLASLNHPHIATIHGLEESDGIRALVMELVEGPTLAERIGHRVMPLDEALPIAKQIAEGLEYAHERGIIHRDLKPANVKLTADGNVKILDFGLAKALESPTPQGNPSISPTLTLEGTRAGVILGTAAYMAPEQARGAIVDKRADIWAFGVVLYEMLTGKQPFAGATVSDTLAAVLTKEPEWGAIPAPMRSLVRQCLEKDPKQRLRDIGDARRALTTSPEAVPEPAQTRAVVWKVTTGLLVMAFLLSLGYLWRVTRPISRPLVRLNVDLPEFASQFPVASAILSPDGTRLVYTGRGSDGKLRLYTRMLDQEQAAPIVGTEDAGLPFFSPDGQGLGFFANDKLKKISFQGGGAVELCDAFLGRGGSWGEDGSIFAALGMYSGLSRIPASGGTAKPLTQLKAEATHRWPQVLPGGAAVLFTANAKPNAGFEGSSIEVLELRTGERKVLVRTGHYGRYVASGHLLYMHRGTLYAAPMDLKRLELTGPAVPVVEGVAGELFTGFARMDVAGSGTLVYVKGREQLDIRKLVWLDSKGGTQSFRPVSTLYRWLRLSPDGKRLVMSIDDGSNSDVWVYEPERAITTRLTSQPGADWSPMWSPDGRHIVFGSDRHGGLINLYWMRADGAGETARLTESKNQQEPMSFSPDGKWLLFREIDGEQAHLWTVSLDNLESDHPTAGKPARLFQTPANTNHGQISPDGRWLAYDSYESGRNEVYVTPFRGSGGKWQVSSGGTVGLPVWSKKTQELFYATNEGIVVVRYRANGAVFEATKPRLWAAMKDLSSGPFDLAPDGKRFVVTQPEATPEEKTPTQVTFLLNFFDELRRRVPAGGK